MPTSQHQFCQRRQSARTPAKLRASQRPATRRKPAARAAAPARASSARAKATTSKHAAPPTGRPAAIGEYAERAVLIPVGAALIARDRVVSGVSDTVSSYSSTSKTKAQLRRFERRGATARNRLEREVRKVRVRVERELRQRRRDHRADGQRHRAAPRHRREGDRTAPIWPAGPGAHPQPGLANPRPSPARSGEAGSAPQAGDREVCRPHIPPAVEALSPPRPAGRPPPRGSSRRAPAVGAAHAPHRAVAHARPPARMRRPVLRCAAQPAAPRRATARHEPAFATMGLVTSR